MSVRVLLEWTVRPNDGTPHVHYVKEVTLAAAPYEGCYIVHSPDWAAERAGMVMIAEDHVQVRFKSEFPATAADSDLIGKLEDGYGWTRL